MDEAAYFVVAVFAGTHLGIAVLMAVITSRAASGRLRRNQWTGIRTPSTMRSDEAWVAGHAAAQRLTPLFFGYAIVACVLLIAVALYGRLSVGLVTTVGSLTFVPFIAIAVYAAVVAGRAAKSADDSAPPPG